MNASGIEFIILFWMFQKEKNFQVKICINTHRTDSQEADIVFKYRNVSLLWKSWTNLSHG